MSAGAIVGIILAAMVYIVVTILAGAMIHDYFKLPRPVTVIMALCWPGILVLLSITTILGGI